MPVQPPLDPRVSRAYARGLEQINGRLMGSHQHAGVQWMLEREICDEECQGGLLADDCGCGKTYMTTCVIAGNALPTTLVISPVSTLHQWRDILIEFGGIRPLVIGGSSGNLNTVPAGTRVVLATYSVFAPKRKGGRVPKIFSTHWDRIILDEGHLIKNQGGVTFTNINKLVGSIRWVLTATPVQNSIKDIAALARWVKWPGSCADFMTIKMLRRTLTLEGARNPRLRLPKLLSTVVKLQFEAENEKRVYNSVRDEFKTRIEHTDDGCKLYTEALEGILRCRQACCHPDLICASRGAGSKRQIDYGKSTKFGYICADIQANLREKSIIFCMWTREIALMLEALAAHNITALKFDGSMSKEARETTLYNFKTAEGINALVIQIQAGGIGLNLQCATRVYITSPTWNPTHELQAICRSHRLGQEQVVNCFRLIIEGTIEERMLDIQGRKMAMISDALGDREMIAKLDLGQLEIEDIRRLFA